MPVISWVLSFECPSDYDLSEFSGLIEALGTIYDKFALITEGYDPFYTYDGKRRWNRGHFPESRLNLRRIRYLLNLEDLQANPKLDISVRGTEIILDALFIVNQTSSWSQEEKSLFWNTLHLGKDVMELLNRAREEAADRIAELEEKYELTFERLIQYVGPELQALNQNRAVFTGSRTGQ